jgi:hypothetical protein
MFNTYPNFQALVNHAIVIDKKRKEMEAKKRRRDRFLEAALVSAPTLHKAISSGGTAPRISNVLRTSSRMATSAPSSRWEIRHHIRGMPTMLP